MWKTLNHGDKVSVGDTIRFRAKSNSLPLQSEIYLVAKTDQHYFEIIKKADNPGESEPPHRLVVLLIDVVYNILLERLSEIQNNSVAS